ncbi:MAG: hypothetical protein FWG94_09400 [Oscillospiraceae bacterium]|nr:hypothetical protein [Oscillospiraceae bacterium]
MLIESAHGGLSYAKEIAKAVLCRAENAPCGQCRDCKKADKDIHPDILVYSGGESSRSFHVDLVRDIRQKAYIRPNEAEAKVIILENAQNMTVAAQNALLKIIEEPPGSTAFILICDNKSALLDTVLSRVSAVSPRDKAEEFLSDADHELQGKAEEIVAALLSGKELSVLAAFVPYERDRAGFDRLLKAVRHTASLKALSLAKEGAGSGNEAVLRLMDIAKAADDLRAGLSQNIGGLLMTAMLTAKLYD